MNSLVFAKYSYLHQGVKGHLCSLSKTELMLKERSGTFSAYRLELIIFQLPLSAPPSTWKELTVNICKTSSKFPFTTLPF